MTHGINVEEALAEVLAGPGPSLVVLRGHRSTGRGALLRRALGRVGAERPVAAHRSLPLPARELRPLLARDLERGLGAGSGAGPSGGPLPASDWSELLGALGRSAEISRRPLVVALDDAHELLAAGDGIHRALLQLWTRLRAHALPVHLVLSGTSPWLERSLEEGDVDLGRAATAILRARPLDLREVGRRVPGYRPLDRVRTWAVFGGSPSVVDLLDPDLTLRDNVRRLLLTPGAPLEDRGMRRLRRDVQSPARYASILRALAVGARDWGQVARGSAGFTSGSQMAPYLARLEELGLVEVRRSLDARPGSRSRRYEIPDPFVAFWFAFVLPLAGRIRFAADPDAWDEAIRPGLDLHVARFFPRACRSWLRRYGDEILPARGREVGGLWGADYDLDVAGTLETGATVYGTARWSMEVAGQAALEDVERQLRRTRYGFGREARLRVAFNAGGFTADALRQAAREPLAHVVGLDDLLGEGDA